jgi:hypothetical protein
MGDVRYKATRSHHRHQMGVNGQLYANHPYLKMIMDYASITVPCWIELKQCHLKLSVKYTDTQKKQEAFLRELVYFIWINL